MVYAHLGNCWTYKPYLVVAADEAEMLAKLNKKTNNNELSLEALAKKLRADDYGHGSPGWGFEIVTPLEI